MEFPGESFFGYFLVGTRKYQEKHKFTDIIKKSKMINISKPILWISSLSLAMTTKYSDNQYNFALQKIIKLIIYNCRFDYLKKNIKLII